MIQPRTLLTGVRGSACPSAARLRVVDAVALGQRAGARLALDALHTRRLS